MDGSALEAAPKQCDTSCMEQTILTQPTVENGRKADYPIDRIFLERWSPRAFTGEEISEQDLLTILEAARWAPSSYNSQPGRSYMHVKTRHPGKSFSVCSTSLIKPG